MKKKLSNQNQHIFENKNYFFFYLVKFVNKYLLKVLTKKIELRNLKLLFSIIVSSAL